MQDSLESHLKLIPRGGGLQACKFFSLGFSYNFNALFGVKMYANVYEYGLCSLFLDIIFNTYFIIRYLI